MLWLVNNLLLFLNLLPFLFYSDKLNPGLIKSSHQTSSPKVSQIGQREIEIGAILRWCISELQNRRLYIKQATSATSVTDKEEEEAEWVEYKIKETNMFTVDKYQQIGFFPKERAFSLRQGVLGEDGTGEESPRFGLLHSL
ncbi:hypothetical protein BRARA_J00018 [Brassica rapa]|uniref:Uncharacterized protein n=1 Tax=Brassica campestris TaxID=3711 RepID=A0A397XNG7_BRACM|nr:hypothetical protein BRARA_J00018 [Brassica rapa]